VAVRQTGSRDPHRGIHIPGVQVEGSQPADAGSRAPPTAPASSNKGKGAAGSSSSPGATGRSEGERRHRMRRADGSFISDAALDLDPPEASEDGWRIHGSQLPGPGRTEARQSSTTTTIRPATTVTATTVRFAATTPGAAAASTATTAAAAGAANVPLPGSLEGPVPQVSGPLFYFFTSLVIISTGINPSSTYQGLLPFCSQSRSHQ
jgi:hypothetical protein